MKNSESYENDVIDYYAQMAKTMGAKVSRLHYTRIAFTKKHVFGGFLLDAGCGNGAYTLPLSKKFSKIVAVDFSSKMLDELRMRLKKEEIGNVEVRKANLLKLPFKDDSFDAVICFSTAYYVKDLSGLLKEFRRVLKKGGILVFDMALSQSLGAIYSKKRFKVPQFFVNQESLLTFIEENNFEVVEKRFFEVMPKVGIPGLLGVLDSDFGGKSLDEIVSNIPLVRRFAFRVLMACRKVK